VARERDDLHAVGDREIEHLLFFGGHHRARRAHLRRVSPESSAVSMRASMQTSIATTGCRVPRVNVSRTADASWFCRWNSSHTSVG